MGGLNMLFFHQTWKQMGEEVAKLSVPERTFYYYRDILYRDGYLTDEDLGLGSKEKKRWIKRKTSTSGDQW